MSNVYTTTIGIFLWKHWKCFQTSWLKNVFMIIVPIAIAGFQIHVTSGNIRAAETKFDPINEVNQLFILFCCDVMIYYFL